MFSHVFCTVWMSGAYEVDFLLRNNFIIINTMSWDLCGLGYMFFLTGCACTCTSPVLKACLVWVDEVGFFSSFCLASVLGICLFSMLYLHV